MREEATLDPAPRTRDAELDAFEALVVVHAPAAFRVALAVVGETLARELLDEAFVAAWRGLPRQREPGRFEPWLHRIVVSRGRPMLRRRGSIREIPVSAWRGDGPVHAPDRLGAADTRTVLASTFAALAYDQRAVIALHYAAGLSLRDVGEALDVPAGTARSRLAAALEALRRGSGTDPADGATSPWARPASGPAQGSVPAQTSVPAQGSVHAGVGPVPDRPEDRMPPQDAHVEAFLASLAGVPVPADLAGAMATHVRERPSRRPSLRLPLLAAGAGLLLTVAVAMAAGWNPPFDLLPGPQEQVSLPPVSPASPDPATPKPSEAWEFAWVVGAGAEVVADPAVKVALGVTPDGGGSDPVLVLERRVVDGRTWVRIEQGGYGWDARFVWIPETIPSVAPTGYDVPVLERTSWLPCGSGEPPSIESLASVTGAQRLACYGGWSHIVGPVQVVRAWDRAKNPGAPSWLAGPVTTMLEGPQRGPDVAMTVPVRVNPALGTTLPSNTWVSVTLHLDDPAAATCTRRTLATDRPVGEPSDQVLWCRQQLVVTGYSEVPAPTQGPPTPIPAVDAVDGGDDGG